MELLPGHLAFSKAGRDKGYPMFILSVSGNDVLVCNGKERPLERPKKKNAKHLAASGVKIDLPDPPTNRALKKALSLYKPNKDGPLNV